ncbi:FimB/Mfa2 family fimbrial subunit [uncultured Prevotella sp.]|uniref:FimB/Mfa2 family fimbrial subunit n=1 Tax=uncultured Prevotella sp. TaxID=159272 RepID=UPI00258DAB12|nr:FimB/Mfa2 family fimbrial subunit [uncultured Prevotella sp.]
MNRKVLFWPLAAVLLTACEKGLDEGIADVAPAGQVTNSVLQVRTRSGGSAGEEATVAYPVTVYVFSGEEYRAVQTIGDEGQTLNIPLVEGTYTVYAIGGASSSDYVLPTQSEGTSTSPIMLKDGHSHGDLMTASATATLVDGGTNTVTLGMTRKTMLIQSVEIKKVPTAATAVSVTIAPLWQSLCVSGTYSTTNASSTIALTKQEDNRTWTNNTSVHLLPPSSQPASVSVNITIGGATKTYTYSCSDQLEAGYRINIDGTYTEAVGVNLTGTITGATWLGERTISFTFDESGSSTSEPSEPNEPSDPSEPSEPSSDFPAVGDTYQGCYVLAVTVDDGGESAELTLLSPNEQAATTTGNADAALAALGAVGISDWAVPTKAQMQLVEAKLLADDASLAGQKYLYRKSNDGLGYRTLGAAETAWPTANTTDSYRLRPVAVVSITKD